MCSESLQGPQVLSGTVDSEPVKRSQALLRPDVLLVGSSAGAAAGGAALLP